MKTTFTIYRGHHRVEFYWHAKRAKVKLKTQATMHKGQLGVLVTRVPGTR